MRTPALIDHATDRTAGLVDHAGDLAAEWLDAARPAAGRVADTFADTVDRLSGAVPAVLPASVPVGRRHRRARPSMPGGGLTRILLVLAVIGLVAVVLKRRRGRDDERRDR
ncbi:MAG: hypothetical protein R2749_04845 [Acidimicrobiales bacterium]